MQQPCQTVSSNRVKCLQCTEDGFGTGARLWNGRKWVDKNHGIFFFFYTTQYRTGGGVMKLDGGSGTYVAAHAWSATLGLSMRGKKSTCYWDVDCIVYLNWYNLHYHEILNKHVCQRKMWTCKQMCVEISQMRWRFANVYSRTDHIFFNFQLKCKKGFFSNSF